MVDGAAHLAPGIAIAEATSTPDVAERKCPGEIVRDLLIGPAAFDVNFFLVEGIRLLPEIAILY